MEKCLYCNKHHGIELARQRARNGTWWFLNNHPINTSADVLKLEILVKLMMRGRGRGRSLAVSITPSLEHFRFCCVWLSLRIIFICILYFYFEFEFFSFVSAYFLSFVVIINYSYVTLGNRWGSHNCNRTLGFIIDTLICLSGSND